MNRKILSGLICVIAVLAAYSAYAEQGRRDDGTECPFIYGHYRQGEGWSWYGAKRIVKTPVEAREIIERIVQTKDVRVLRITDQPHFFVGEIINKNGEIVDRVLIDKRTGRIRSMY
jgi:hypothetical protein